MNNEIKNYYSNKINIDYANNIKNICKYDKVFNKFIKLCFRHDISFINITKDNIYEILSIDKLLQICNNLKKTKVLKLGNYIMEGNPSATNARIETDYNGLSGKYLSKYSSFFVSVPKMSKKYSYYTFKLPKEDKRKMLIKILEYESKK